MFLSVPCPTLRSSRFLVYSLIRAGEVSILFSGRHNLIGYDFLNLRLSCNDMSGGPFLRVKSFVGDTSGSIELCMKRRAGHSL